MNLPDNTIETRKILIASDGDIYLRRFRKFNLPLTTTRKCQLVGARWSGDYPSVVSPKSSRTSRLPFQSRLESSVIALTLSYAVSPSRARDQRSFRAIIPRAKLLAGPGAGEWDASSFRLFTLGCQVPTCSSWSGGCSIAGTRWVNQCLQVFDFNTARVRSAARAGPPGHLPTPIVHATDVKAAPGFKRDIVPALPFCHTFPRNQFGDVYDGVLADDERIVAFRYKVGKHFVARWMDRAVLMEWSAWYNDDGLTMDVVFDVWTI